jgi:hypothetical protein
MHLRDLDARFIRREIRPCDTEHEYLVPVDAIADADGVWFDCPKCTQTNGGPIGTHAIICWRPRVPAEVSPKPGRWEFEGTGLDDLTLVAGSSSILLTGEGSCAAHFFIRNGTIEMT